MMTWKHCISATSVGEIMDCLRWLFGEKTFGTTGFCFLKRLRHGMWLGSTIPIASI